jgi:hypothetical protein
MIIYLFSRIIWQVLNNKFQVETDILRWGDTLAPRLHSCIQATNRTRRYQKEGSMKLNLNDGLCIGALWASSPLLVRIFAMVILLLSVLTSTHKQSTLQNGL